MSVDVLDLTCPKCGGTMEPDRAKGSLHCPYCDFEQLLSPSDEDTLEAKAYARQKGILHAQAEAENERKRKIRKKRLILFGVVAIVISSLILISCVYNALRTKVDPFNYITVEFSGKTGDGSAEIVINDADGGEVDPHEITYSVTPKHYLNEGDRVTVTAVSSTYALSPTSKTYTVEGLDNYLTELDSLSDKAVEMIHNKSDILVDRVATSAFVDATSVTPCMMYLTTDGKTNMLYDVYRIVYPEKDGSECERFAVIYYKNVIVHDTDEPSMSYDSSMYYGQIIEALNKTYAGYITGYKTLKDAKADVLSHQSSAVTLQEREA